MKPRKKQTREREKMTRKQRIRGWVKFVLFLFVLLAAAATGGFIVFANTVKSMTTPDPVPQADGIVVLTGKGGGRLDAGAKLLAEGKAERLLISGVNPEIARKDIIALLGLPDELSDCCIDLDPVATDTISNATETAAWTKAMAYEHIILVTSAYHMPRAQSEISLAIGRIRITPYPVVSEPNEDWWTSWTQFRRLATEYSKLLVTYAREPNDKDKLGAPLLETVPEPESEAEPDE